MIVVTGATGKLGRLVIEALLKTVNAGTIIAAVRSPAKAADLAALGVQVREADYNRPETLTTALEGAAKVLLISSNEIGVRVAQHQAVIDAARAAGVKLLAYTSLLGLETSKMYLAADHKATEAALKVSGVPYAMLRDGWYLENHTTQLGAALTNGAILGAAGEGRFSAAAQADYAAAAAAVLTGRGHEGKAYELGGDTSYTYAMLAAEVTKQSGKQVVYKDLQPTAYAEALKGFGLPAEVAEMLADSDAHAKLGALETTSKDLSGLIGRPTTPLSDAVKAALAG